MYELLGFFAFIVVMWIVCIPGTIKRNRERDQRFEIEKHIEKTLRRCITPDDRLIKSLIDNSILRIDGPVMETMKFEGAKQAADLAIAKELKLRATSRGGSHAINANRGSAIRYVPLIESFLSSSTLSSQDQNELIRICYFNLKNEWVEEAKQWMYYMER